MVSFAYERGWRDNFKRSGFPGVEVEKDNAMEALGEDAVGDVIIDCSCGSGLFTREFARSGKYDGIVALDFSESMIKEAMERAQKDTSVPADKIAFVRADVGRLPFANDSIGGVSASAAIHCWPDVQSACAEIFRVLKPEQIVEHVIERLICEQTWDERVTILELGGFTGPVTINRVLGRDDFTREGLLVLESAKAVRD